MCTVHSTHHRKKQQKGLYGGYATFVVSIGMIGACTAVIGDVAGHLGCFIYLKDTVNAIAFVALGTSVPGKNSKRTGGKKLFAASWCFCIQ